MVLHVKKTDQKIIYLVLLTITSWTNAKIVPPPWANPSTNPCATQPRGWQLLYWPPDGKCYKIYQVGYPCPETMELSPITVGNEIKPECRCPPGTAQSPRDALCHQIFTKASCPSGQYFAPVPDAHGKPSTKQRWGICREPEPCDGKGEIYWPKDGKCYPKFTRGPCPKGELLSQDEDGLATCGCSEDGELGRYFSASGATTGCWEHYSKGPCTEHGELFLPGGECGCHADLPHYHPESGACYQLGGTGPCRQGHHFVVLSEQEDQDEPIRADCTCKPQYAAYEGDGICYRLYTQGPCASGEMLMNSTTCVQFPCKRGRLYFPEEDTCYKVGSRGPCPSGQMVLYDYGARPSYDGIAYNGVCGCTNALRLSGKCSEATNDPCEENPGFVLMKKTCYALYSQGPCMEGEWLVPRRQPRNTWREDQPYKFRDFKNMGKASCECRPGYTRVTESGELENNSLFEQGKCQPPIVTLAKYLNDKVRKGQIIQPDHYLSSDNL